MGASIAVGSQALGAAGGIGSLVSGVGSIFQGQDEKKTSGYNAAIYEQQAQAERSNAQLMEAQKRRMIKSTVGSQTAGYGKAGVKNSGSALQVAMDSLTNGALDISIGKYNSEVAARRNDSEAQNIRREGSQDRNANYLSGGKSILSGALKIGQALIPAGGKK